jgi:hypothetical protein
MYNSRIVTFQQQEKYVGLFVCSLAVSHASGASVGALNKGFSLFCLWDTILFWVVYVFMDVWEFCSFYNMYINILFLDLFVCLFVAEATNNPTNPLQKKRWPIQRMSRLSSGEHIL